MPKLMKRPPIDEVADLIELLDDVPWDIWESCTPTVRAALEKHNDIKLALPGKRPVREELAEWLDKPLPDPVEWNWESTEDCRDTR